MTAIRPGASRPVCDGYDIATEHGVLHFDHEPTEAEVAAAIESLAAPEPERVEVIAEDGAVL